MSLGASEASSPRPLAIRASGLLLLALWLVQMVDMTVGLSSGATALALGLFAAYLLLALGLAGRSNSVLSLLLAVGTIAITGLDRAPDALFAAGEDAIVFTAFLPALHLLRGVAAGHPAILRYRQRLAEAPPGTRAPQLLLGGHALGGALMVGAVAVLSPAIRAEPDEKHRRRAALALVAGISLAALWSPLFVSMAVVSAFVPGVPLPALMAVGAALAASGLAIALWRFRRLLPGSVNLRLTIRNLGPLLPCGAAAAVIVVVLRSVTAWSTLEAASLVIPLFCFAIGWPPTGPGFRRAWTRTLADLGGMSGEVAVVSLAFVLGAMMHASPTVAGVSGALALGSHPAAVTLFGVSAAIAGSAALGAHPIVGASLALGVVKPEEGVLSELALASAALLGWSCGAMVAVAGLLVIVAVGMLGLTRRDLVLGENALLVVVMLGVGTVLLTAVNALTI